MKLCDFYEWLDSFLNFEKTQTKGIFWLDGMNFLCNQLKNPQNSFKSIHVAGSKGKGSTCKMIACILSKANFFCGIYSSPHIVDFRERICHADGFFSDEIYEKSADELYECVKNIKTENLPHGRHFTWFELVTAYSFLCFKNAKVDYAVIEVGLGGRLDSTNIILPKICVINEIEKEHTEFLGDTVEKIALEKAGIIKKDVPVVIGKQKYTNVLETFRTQSKKMNSSYIIIDNLIKNIDIHYSKDSKMKASFFCDQFNSTLTCRMKLLGKEQIFNAYAAIYACKTIEKGISKKQCQKGIEKAFLRGRFEVLKKIHGFKNIPFVILDGAHTKNSMEFTLQTLDSILEKKSFLCDLLFSCAKDKDISKIAPLFVSKFKNVTITRPGTIRQSNICEIQECFAQNKIDFTTENDCQMAIKLAVEKANKSKNALLVVGSFYLLAEFYKSPFYTL